MEEKPPKNWNWATWCVSWLPLGFTWPLEHYSCSLQNADRAGKGSVMGPGADLFLNLLTKCLLKPCQSSAPAAQKPLQTTMKDLLLSQNPQTRTNHLKPPLAALSESVMLQNCSTSMRKQMLQNCSTSRRKAALCENSTLFVTEFTRKQPLPPAFSPLYLFPSLNSVPQLV